MLGDALVVIEGLSFTDYSLILLATTMGALVQGSIGFGAALVAVPAIALAAPEALPATVIIWVVPLAVAMVIRERRGVDWSGVRWIVLGRLPGTAIGAWVVAVVASKTLSVLAGGVVLLAVVTSLLSAAVPLTRATKTAAGFASGLMGTSTSIGGPPLALLYQHEDGAVVRSTLAASFTVGTLLSLASLSVAGAIESWQVLLALALQPGLMVGLALSRPVSRYLDDRWLRPTVLGFAAVAATLAIARGV